MPPRGESTPWCANGCVCWRRHRDATAPLIVVSRGAVGRVVRGLYLSLTPAEVVVLGEPQHVAFRLQDGKIEEIVADGDGDATQTAALFSPSSPA